MKELLGLAMVLGVATIVLSVGQAWAMTATAPWTRYLVVWALATMIVTGLVIWVTDPGAEALRRPSLVLSFPLYLGPWIAAALGIGVWRAHLKRLAGRPWDDVVVALAGIHFAALLVSGFIGFVVLSFVALSRIH